jgi:hypothetical protein
VTADGQCQRFGCTPYIELNGTATCEHCGRTFAPMARSGVRGAEPARDG